MKIISVASLSLFIGLLSPTLGGAQAQSNSVDPLNALSGRWISSDHVTVVDVGPCSNRDRFCATVISDKEEPSLVGHVALQDIAPSGKNKFSGRYVVDGANILGTITQISADAFDFKVCVVLSFCQTSHYLRLKA